MKGDGKSRECSRERKEAKEKKRHREVEEPKENQVIEARGLKDAP